VSGTLAGLAGIDIPTGLLIGGEWTFELMTEHTDSLARLMVAENGKALRDAKAEATYAAEFFRWYAEEAVRIDAMVVGPGIDAATDIGPLVNESTRTKVAELVDSAAADGGKPVTGGRAPDRRGYFYQPTVIDQVPPGAGILGTEIFGPVAPVVRFTAEADAVAWANDTEFGLVSYVYTGDLSRGLRVCEALETGMVGLNRGIVSDPAAPFGGVKQSGIGREGAHDGLLEFTETKYIATNW
jgi:succinate-semialdehyde dehydrogenase/glutarate-semialdehyde dehydrogenase